MFTPEFVSDERGEYVLAANHSLTSAESIRLSIAYNRARIKFGSSNLPTHIQNCRLVYDIRGQSLPNSAIDELKSALEGDCTVEFKQ